MLPDTCETLLALALLYCTMRTKYVMSMQFLSIHAHIALQNTRNSHLMGRKKKKKKNDDFISLFRFSKTTEFRHWLEIVCMTRCG